MTRIVADEHLVDLENCAQLTVESFCRDVCQVEIDLVLAANTHSIDAYLKDLSGGNIAWHEVAVSRIFFLEEVPSFVLRNRRRRPHIAFLARHPNTPAFAARRFRHQPQLVFAGNRCGVNLYELAVCVSSALLVTSGGSTTGADH